MGNNVTVTRGDEKFEFENIVMHQIGNGAVQIVERNGNQTVVNRFDEVYITLDEESRAQFDMDLAQLEAQNAPAVEAEVVVDEDGEVVEEEAPTVQ